MPIPTMRRIALLACLALVTMAVKPADARDSAAQRGIASYYHPERFTGRPMANGVRFDPNSNSAAHRSLPFGTVVEVTNLRNGRSRIVVIEDRGPFIAGRIIDLSPRIAGELGMLEAGLAQVEVRPISEADRLMEAFNNRPMLEVAEKLD